MSANTSRLGERIRSLRRERGLTLRQLSERCDLSVNAIGLIERGRNSPTVASLQSLATAIGVEITDFFQRRSEDGVVHVPRTRRLTATGAGFVMESLGIGLDRQQLEPFFVKIEPGRPDPEPAVRHPGQEFVYCLSGSIEYEIDDRTYHLDAGDSLLFAAEQPHRFRNPSDQAAELILVFQSAEGRLVARDRHLRGEHGA